MHWSFNKKMECKFRKALLKIKRKCKKKY